MAKLKTNADASQQAAPPVKEEEEYQAATPADPDDDGDENEDDDEDGDGKEKAAEPAPTQSGRSARPSRVAAILTAADRQEIRELCKLAGNEAMAVQFIAKKMGVVAVCEALNNHRAEESASVKMTSYVNPLQTGQTIKDLESQAADYARQNGGMTREQAFTRMLEQNPQVYAAFQRQHSAKALKFRLGESVTL